MVKRLSTTGRLGFDPWVGKIPWRGMATHSSTIAWKIPWMEEPGRLHGVHGVAESQTQLSDFTFTFINSTINPIIIFKLLKAREALHGVSSHH